MNQLVTIASPALPALVAAAGELCLLLWGQVVARMPPQGVVRNRKFFCD